MTQEGLGWHVIIVDGVYVEAFLKIILGVFLAWLAYRMIQGLRQNATGLDRASLSKSFTTMGLLALGLISFIGFAANLLSFIKVLFYFFLFF